MKTRDINTFRLNTIVDVPGVPQYKEITIVRISDCGVTVDGAGCGKNMIISGRTPAILSVENKENEIKEVEVNKVDPVNPIKTTAIVATSNPDSGRVPRGTYTEKMKHLDMPTVSPFTIKDFAELNGIPINYALDWVKSNCAEVGKTPRIEGQRGKSAALYKLNNS